MAVRPPRLLALWRAAPINLALLAKENVRAFRVFSTPDGGLRGRDFLQRPAEMHRGSTQASRVLPWDRSSQSPIELEDSGTVAKAFEAVDIAPGQDGRRDGGELRGTRV